MIVEIESIGVNIDITVLPSPNVDVSGGVPAVTVEVPSVAPAIEVSTTGVQGAKGDKGDKGDQGDTTYVGNIDGGMANSVYGGIFTIEGGGA